MKEQKSIRDTFFLNRRSIEIIQVILDTMEQKVEQISEYMKEKQPESLDLLQKLDQRSDMYCFQARNILLKGIFLDVNQFSYTGLMDSIEEIRDLLQQIIRRLDILSLPEWVEEHYLEMIEHILTIIRTLKQWIKDEQKEIGIEDLEVLSKEEDNADTNHSIFLKKLYTSETLTYQALHLIESMENRIEQSIDAFSLLSQRLFIVIQQHKLSLEEPPTYLS